jgi:hypothetical protein
MMSASMAKEGVDLNSMLHDFQTSTPAQAATPPAPEYDFSMPVVQTPTSTPPVPEFDFAIPASTTPNSSTDDMVISSVAEIASSNPVASTRAVEADDAVFEFDLDDIDEVQPVSALHNPDLIPTEVMPANTIAVSSSFDQDHIMTVNDDHDVVSHDHVTLSLGHEDIPVHVSGVVDSVSDPLEHIPFELDVNAHHEPARTLIVDDATFPIEAELVVDTDETPVVHQPASLSLEGLAAGVLGAGVLGAALGHAPIAHDLDLELEMPVVAEPALHLEPVVVSPEPMIGQFDPEPVVIQAEPEPMIARLEPEPVHVEPELEPVHVEPELEPVHVEPEPVIAHAEPEPVVIHAEPEPVVIHAEPEPVVIHAEPEPVIAHVEPEPVQLEPAPVLNPEVVATPMHLESVAHSGAGSVAAPGVHKDFFNTNILRRQFNASALIEIRAQISKALNGREVQLGVFVGRAAQRGLYLLGTTDSVTLNKLEHQLVPLSTTGLHHGFIEAVQSVNHAEAGVANGLAVLDASDLGVDDLVLPTGGALLALGQINNNLGTLTLSGDFPAKAGTEFLAHVAQSLETPVGLVL